MKSNFKDMGIKEYSKLFAKCSIVVVVFAYTLSKIA
jgi:hypothetical protein